MRAERAWAAEAEFILHSLVDERRSDAKAFYRPPANPIHHVNGNDRARFMAETMRRLLPHFEQLARNT